ncbi:MAG: hypothetical protein VYE22_29340 [Myxococcota bacterium]|nr:hypothetical protein [Myxococcota bacterium]
MSTSTRTLRVGARIYRTRVRHEHEAGPCAEVLTFRSDLPRSAPLRIVFRAGADRGVGDGWPSGHVALRGAALNLHRPRVARALLDEALARGWDEVTGQELDGWTLFDAARARMAS